MNNIKFKADVCVTNLKSARVRLAICLIRLALVLMKGKVEITEAKHPKPKKQKTPKQTEAEESPPLGV